MEKNKNLTENRKALNYYFCTMKVKLKLFYAPTEETYYIYYFKGYSFALYKVENINPLNIYPIDSFGVVHTSSKNIIDAVEEFAKKEFEKLNFGY